MAKHPPDEGVTLPGAPVRLVVLSVEYPLLSATTEQFATIRQALRDRFPVADHSPEAAPIGGSLAPPIAVPSFSTRDRTTRVAVMPNQVVIETRRYDHLDWFLDMIAEPLGAVREVFDPDGVLAIGHRFIDEVHLPGNGADELARWFDPALLALPNLFGASPDNWQGILSVAHDDEASLTLRYGPIAQSLVPDVDGSTGVFTHPVVALDWDSRWSPRTVPEFDIDVITDRIRSMYEPVRSLFRRICTDDLWTTFGKPVEGAT